MNNPEKILKPVWNPSAEKPLPVTEIRDTTAFEPLCQVVLFNDDINTFDYVIACLMRIFKHSQDLAIKISIEAHQTGRTIAEVESRDLAEQHAAALLQAGLSARVEKI